MKRSELLQLLPGIFQRGLLPSDPAVLERLEAELRAPEGQSNTLSALGALVDVQVALHAPAEEALAGFPENLVPERAPSQFLPLLAQWLHLDRGMAPDEAALRSLLTHAARLWRQRGTQRGLEQALECVLGAERYTIETPDPPPDVAPREAVRFYTFHVRIRVVQTRRPWRLHLERLVDAMKPIHVSHDLVFDLPA